MKKTFTFIFTLWFFPLLAQENCRKRTLNTLEKAIIREYITEAQKSRWFKNDIGIVVVKEDLSKYPEKKWELLTYIDYSFRLDSTFSYLYYDTDLILFKTITKENIPAFKNIDGCWKDLISDRLFVKLPKENRAYKLTVDGWEDGKPLLNAEKKQVIASDRHRRSYFDGSISDRVYVFSEKRGIIQKGRIP